MALHHGGFALGSFTTAQLNSALSDADIATAAEVAAAQADATAALTRKRCLYTLSISESAVDYTTIRTIPFDTETQDVGGFSIAAGVITIPADVDDIIVRAQVQTSSVVVSTQQTLDLYKNGAALTPAVKAIENTASTGSCWQLISYPLTVVPGDTFELKMTVADASMGVSATSSWLSIEVLP